MKVSKVYSNDDRFKTVSFSEGLNIILAKVKRKNDLNRDSHGLGKSTLVTVIDFLLLKQLSKEHIFRKYANEFKEHTFFGELQLNDGSFLTIKRSVVNNTKISFKKHNDCNQHLVEETKWDKKNISLKKAKNYLNEQMNFSVLNKLLYRKSISYFLRTQDDYRDVFQLVKYNRANDVDWKPFLFNLLGFDSKTLLEKYQLEKKVGEQEKLISDLKRQFAIDPDEVDKINAAIELKEEEKSELVTKIDNFNFYEKESQLKKEIVTNIEDNIATKNTLTYNISYEIEQIEKSLKQPDSFDLEEVTQVFKESGVFFPKELLKSYEELIAFNKSITQERHKFLNQRLEQLKKDLETVNKQLIELNNERVKLLNFLQERDSFQKFKNYQKQVTDIQATIVNLKAKRDGIIDINHLKGEISEQKVSLDEAVRGVKQQLQKLNESYTNIRKHFRNIIKYILNAPALLYIDTNKIGNIEFKAEIQKENEIETTAEGSGNSYKKMLCVAFDLAILMNYSSSSFYRFVYHDGALEALDNRKKLNYLNKVQQICKEYNLQYIFTSIEHDLPPNLNSHQIQFHKAVELSDLGEEGKLFGFTF